MAQLDTLGQSGGPAGVEDAVEVVAGTVGIVDRGGLGDQGLVGQDSDGWVVLADEHDGTEVGHAPTQGIDHRGERVVD